MRDELADCHRSLIFSLGFSLRGVRDELRRMTSFIKGYKKLICPFTIPTRMKFP
jgi:hypothetical protein